GPAQVGPSPAVAALSRRFAELLAREGPGAGHSVRELAGVLGVSVSYLSEAVKSATGRTPAQLVRDAQVLEAKRLLSGTDLTVQRVARDAGFADAAYFCRFFRRETGLSPGEFRRAVVRNHHAPRSLSIDA
ncbi:helix-turn-helix transcriptional regulator, partial [Streptomyces oceani]